jgi:hypothetical protein
MSGAIDKVIDRLSHPLDFTWPGSIVLLLVVVGLCALLAGVLR